MHPVQKSAPRTCSAMKTLVPGDTCGLLSGGGAGAAGGASPEGADCVVTTVSGPVTEHVRAGPEVDVAASPGTAFSSPACEQTNLGQRRLGPTRQCVCKRVHTTEVCTQFYTKPQQIIQSVAVWCFDQFTQMELRTSNELQSPLAPLSVVRNRNWHARAESDELVAYLVASPLGRETRG